MARQFDGSRCGVTVEMFGSAGSGKSTLARRLVATLCEGQATVVTGPLGGPQVGTSRAMHHFERLRWAFHGLTRRREPMLRGVHMRGFRQTSPKESLSVTINWWAKAGLLNIAATTPGVTVLEEGPAHAIWSAALKSTAPSTGAVSDDLARIVPLGRLHLFVHVSVSPDVALTRLRHRGRRGHRLLERGEAHNTVSHTARIQRASSAAEAFVHRVLKSNCNAYCVRVDNSHEGGVDECVRDILTSLRGVCRTMSCDLSHQ